ncbi:MAG: UDP-N-acetylmuramoyl-tripeptide--D-alanyl-D-alanine ligase [Saprospiraceae bacterium]|jgi:UDP-N-acetylmuramoyl-tripeptide--D-alanyl-D-alanine ligase
MKTSELHKIYLECSGISIDSRSISENQLFFALKGPNFDGHLYVESALKEGAKYAIIEDERYIGVPNTILVTNVERALQDLARYHRTTLKIPIIGLTGSNGKTTTKELLASVLCQKFEVFATKGNLNNHLGVPISILSIKTNHTIAIIEMGANHQGEIKFLSEISMPNYGLITNIGKAHLEGFGNIEGVRKAKTELYEFLRKVKGQIFFDCSDKYLLKSIEIEDNAIAYDSAQIIILNEFPYLKISYNQNEYSVNLSGAYNATNMLAAIKIGQYFQITNKDISKGLSAYVPSNNRSEIKNTEDNILILDAYNANPSSMRVSIENIYKAKTKNKTLIIGHMLELGLESKSEHQDLVNYIKELGFRSVFLVGEEFQKVDIPQYFDYFSDTTSLQKCLSDTPLTNQTILLKGSRGIALEKLIPLL